MPHGAQAESLIPIIVVGNSTTALSCIRLVRALGHPVYAACKLDSWPTRTRYYHPLPASKGRIWRGELGVAGYQALRDLPFPECVLIPAADDAAIWLSALPEDLSTKVRVSVAPLEAMNALQDKAEFAGLLDRLKVPCPRTFELESDEDLSAIPFDEIDSLFLKPTDSQRFVNVFAKKAIWVRNREEAGDAWSEVAASGLALVAQEYVSGGSDDHYFIDGFRDRTGVVRAKIARRRIRIYPADFGNSSYCRSEPFDIVASAWPGLERILEHLDYRGIFSAEFKRDAHDGQFKILEINTRPWVFIEFAGKCGINMCELYICDALGHDVPTISKYGIGMHCFDLYNDLVAVVELPASQRPKLLATFSLWLRGFKLLASISDPAPALYFMLSNATRKVRKVFSS